MDISFSIDFDGAGRGGDGTDCDFVTVERDLDCFLGDLECFCLRTVIWRFDGDFDKVSNSFSFR